MAYITNSEGDRISVDGIFKYHDVSLITTSGPEKGTVSVYEPAYGCRIDSFPKSFGTEDIIGRLDEKSLRDDNCRFEMNILPSVAADIIKNNLEFRNQYNFDFIMKIEAMRKRVNEKIRRGVAIKIAIAACLVGVTLGAGTSHVMHHSEEAAHTHDKLNYYSYESSRQLKKPAVFTDDLIIPSAADTSVMKNDTGNSLSPSEEESIPESLPSEPPLSSPIQSDSAGQSSEPGIHEPAPVSEPLSMQDTPVDEVAAGSSGLEAAAPLQETAEPVRKPTLAKWDSGITVPESPLTDSIVPDASPDVKPASFSDFFSTLKRGGEIMRDSLRKTFSGVEPELTAFSERISGETADSERGKSVPATKIARHHGHDDYGLGL